VRTYVVRISTTEDKSEQALRGVVDEVATGKRETFQNSEELIQALSGTANSSEATEGARS
jgi:hypothetical protein